jgi:O-antigen ligase
MNQTLKPSLVVAKWFERFAFMTLLIAFAFSTLSGGGTYFWALFGLRVLTLVAMAFWLISVVLAWRWQPVPRVFVVLVLLYFFWSLICVWQSRYTYAGLDQLASTAMYLAGFWLAITTVTSDSRRRWWFATMLLVTFGHGTYAVLQSQGVLFTPRLDQFITSTYFNPNFYAGFLDLAVPFCLALTIFTTHKTTRVVAGVLSVLMLVNLVLTESWGGRLAVLISLGLLLLYLTYKKSGIGFAQNALVLTLILGGFAGAVMYRVVQANQPALTTKIKKEFSIIIGLRGFIYQGNLELIKQHPVFGVGPGNYVRAITKFRAPKADGMGNATHHVIDYAHHDIMHMAAETGLIGAILYLSLIIVSIWFGRSIPILFALIGLIGHGLGDGNFSSIQGNTFMGFVMLGLLVSTRVQKTVPTSAISGVISD